MRVLIFAGNSGSGGLKGYIKGIISACKDRNDKIYVLCTPKFSVEISSICKISNVGIISMDECAMGFWKVLFSNKLHKSVRKAIDDICPDVIFYTNSIIHKGTEKYINALSFHNQLYVDHDQLSRMKFSKTWLTLNLHRRRVIWSIKNADITIFDSQQSYEQSLDVCVNVHNPVVAYFGVDASERANTYRHNNDLHTPTRLIYVSTLFPYKNQAELILAIKELKSRGYNIHLDVIGSGDKKYTKHVNSLIKSNGLKEDVTLHSWVDHKIIKDMIDEADIYIYASSIETSGFGLMEGMTRGVPIACNNESCMPEILKGAGILFDIFSVSDTADKIQMLIDRKELRNKVAKDVFDIATQYTWENNVDIVFGKFQEYIGG